MCVTTDKSCDWTLDCFHFGTDDAASSSKEKALCHLLMESIDGALCLVIYQIYIWFLSCDWFCYDIENFKSQFKKHFLQLLVKVKLETICFFIITKYDSSIYHSVVIYIPVFVYIPDSWFHHKIQSEEIKAWQFDMIFSYTKYLPWPSLFYVFICFPERKAVLCAVVTAHLAVLVVRGGQ